MTKDELIKKLQNDCACGSLDLYVRTIKGNMDEDRWTSGNSTDLGSRWKAVTNVEILTSSEVCDEELDYFPDVFISIEIE